MHAELPRQRSGRSENLVSLAVLRRVLLASALHRAIIGRAVKNQIPTSLPGRESSLILEKVTRRLFLRLWLGGC